MSLIHKSALKILNIFSYNTMPTFKILRCYSEVSLVVQKSTYSDEEKRKYRADKKFERKSNVLIKDNYLDSCEYYFENGLRKVRPYNFTFQVYAKERWFNKSLLDVFITEYNMTKLSFIERIKSGKILINNLETSVDYSLKVSDLITSRVHRHELPVLDKPIKVIHEDDNVLVICKPSSIPIHSVGKYNFNTVLGILAKYYGRNQLRIVHRIDRMTSGILILAKNYKTSLNFFNQIQNHQVSKFYLAIAKGQFNSGSCKLVECDQSIGPLYRHLGLWHALSTQDGGKAASTKFLFLKYDSNSDTSLVLCKPLTGKTHQIRIHLQYLGHPITNDPIYNCCQWGQDFGKGAIYHKSKEQLIEDLTLNHPIAFHQALESGNFKSVSPADETVDIYIPASHFDPDCDECARKISYNIDPANLVLYLHAYRYRSSSDDWDYLTDLPDWTNLFYRDDLEREAVIAKLDMLTRSNNDF